MRTLRPRSFGVSALVAVTVASASCAALKAGTTSDGGPTEDASAPDVAAPVVDGEPPSPEDGGGPKPDRGAPPLDTVCPEWSEKVTPVNPEVACDARRRIPIETGPILTRRLGVAVTDTGKIVAAYGAYSLDDASELHVTHFGAFGPALSAKATVALGNGLSNEIADAVAVAKGEGDEVHVVTNDFEQAPTGRVSYRRFSGGALGTSSVVTENVPRGAPLALAAGPGGELLVSSFRPNGADAAQGGLAVSMYRAGSAERFGVPAPFSTTVDTRTTTFAGSASLAREPSGIFLSVYCEAQTAGLGQPTSIAKVRAFSPSGGWGAGATTLHNRVPDGLTALDPAFVSRDGVRYATFFHVPANASSAQLVSLVWAGEAEPVLTVLEREIKLPGAGKSASFAQAMAVDSFGQMHIVLHEERPSSQSASLTYLRQTRADGLTKWIREDIDDDVSERDQPGRVAITLDARDRPHFVYYAQKRATVMYATRFDR